ncbi:hypothetical protein EO98_11135 [Methanosarcina sp. 2.H.T.1A.6]|nr:hypothetical protein EO97_15455 [Methanosarcina sp. 2.H.T.1A.15]KKG15527.1 hypothetical protein EO94_11165 [Methanosarcina sp. 2.H.T.1A.3]KKG24162.1 hypothetical protein EO98_11135 [Methanosarcina sp. 2.H.T.1A.6]KKG25632.1 hypothetical protein EO96_19010 [Methanosarcina sp. 2.H.T.1A.8]
MLFLLFLQGRQASWRRRFILTCELETVSGVKESILSTQGHLFSTFSLNRGVVLSGTFYLVDRPALDPHGAGGEN